MYLPEDIEDILRNREHEVLEFKEAKNNFDSRERSDYCTAIANAGGGRLLLGVDDIGNIVGTSVYRETLNKVPHDVYQKIGITVSVEEVPHSKGRVVVFDVPPRPVGRRVKSDGHYKYPIRKGESTVEMDDEDTRKILNEVRPDFSAGIVEGLTIEDLEEDAIANFRKRRVEKTGNSGLETEPVERILKDAGLVRNGEITHACLILLGKREIITNLLPQSEVIYEWRSAVQQIHHDFRKSWRAPYFAVYDEIWETIYARNLRTPYQEGFVQQEVLAFDEKSCREAVNNAIAHRDYSIGGRSTIIHASPDAFTVVSPGGFPMGITPENILEAAPHWRNRLIAEAFEQTKLVERSGQGIDNIFEASIRQGKGLPSFQGTDNNTVQINVPAKVQDAEFIKFLEKLVNEKQINLSFDEILELEQLRGSKLLPSLRHKEKFLRLGIVERVGKTKGTKYMLSHRYYTHKEKPGIYTKIKGITREHKKQLILEHINREGSGRRDDFLDAFPKLKTSDISNLLQELKRGGKIERIGSDRAGYWQLKRDPN